ncbi:hypothetical protein HAX54_027696, partial [Datura stramonium]|nr:hypothetical protein [Datura stramonium]
DNVTANERTGGGEVEDWQPLLVVFREVRLLVSDGEGRYRGGLAGSGCCIPAGSVWLVAAISGRRRWIGRGKDVRWLVLFTGEDGDGRGIEGDEARE